MGLFKEFGIDNFSLKKKVSRRIRSKKLKKRRQPINYKGREYKDYLEYVKDHPLNIQLKWILFITVNLVHIFKPLYSRIQA